MTAILTCLRSMSVTGDVSPVYSPVGIPSRQTPPPQRPAGNWITPAASSFRSTSLHATSLVRPLGWTHRKALQTRWEILVRPSSAYRSVICTILCICLGVNALPLATKLRSITVSSKIVRAVHKLTGLGVENSTIGADIRPPRDIPSVCPTLMEYRDLRQASQATCRVL